MKIKKLAAMVLAWVLVCTLSGGVWSGPAALAAEGDPEEDLETVSGEEELARRTSEMRAIPFSDVPRDVPWGDAVRYAAYRGLIRGEGPNTFSPDGLATRSLACAVLYRLHRAEGGDPAAVSPEGALEVLALSRTTGVPYTASDGEGAAGPVARETPLLWAVSAGICQGNENGLQPDAVLTRAQWAAFLYRYARYAGLDTSCSGDLSGWRDGGSVPDYARTPFSWALERGIFASVIDDEIHPRMALSRAQIAQTVTSFLAAKGEDPLAVQSACVLPAAAPSLSREKHGQIQAAVEAAAAKYGASGLQVAVIEDGRVTDTYAWGWAVKGGEPMTADHKLRVASISKVVVAMDAMLLRERGTVDLDAPIGTYWGAEIRDPYHPDAPPTIRQILTHTSAITAFGDETSRAYGPVRSALTGGAAFRSSTAWAYNNYAFGVLGMTLELAAGRTMDDMLGEYLFRPMDIDGAFCAGDLRDTGRLAALYRHDGSLARSVEMQKGIHAGEPGSTGTYFAGGLTISARDLGRLVSLLAADGRYEGLQLLAPESVEELERHGGRTVGGFYQAQPLRYQAGMYGREGLYYHTGSAYGVYNCFSYDPVARDGVVVLSVGASAAHDSRGVYAVCGNIMQEVYDVLGR